MRRHFGLSLEAAVIPQVTLPKVTVSLEDEELIFDEAREAGVQAEAGLNEADRILEVSDALEDLAVIADNIDSATPTEVALIQNSAQMAVAGTDIDPDEMIPVPVIATEDDDCDDDKKHESDDREGKSDDKPESDPASAPTGGEDGEPAPASTEGDPAPVTDPAASDDSDVTKLEVPGLEAYVGRKIATEGMREVATTLYRNLEIFLAKTWDSIVHFFHNIWVGIPRVMDASKKLREAIKKLDHLGTAKGGVIKVTTGIKALYVDGSPVKNASTLVSELDSLSNISEYVFKTYTKEVSDMVDKVATIYGKFNPANSGETVSEIRKALKDNMFKKFPSRSKGSPDANGYSSLQSDNYLGNISLLCKVYDDKMANATDLAVLERVRGSRIYVVDSETTASAGEIEFKVLEPGEMLNILTKVDALLKQVYEYDNGAGYKALLATRAKMRTASAAATAAMAKFKDDTTRANYNSIEAAGNNMAVSFYKGGLNFNQSLARWTLNPCGNMVTHNIAVAKSVLNLVRKSIAVYPELLKQQAEAKLLK